MSNLEQTQAASVALTPSAAEAVRNLMTEKNLAEDYALRVYIAGSSCSGLQYGMALDNNIRPTDLLSKTSGIKVVVDEVSIQYLQGASIDYITSGEATGFKIDNPNAFGCSSHEGGCAGCGSGH